MVQAKLIELTYRVAGYDVTAASGSGGVGGVAAYRDQHMTLDQVFNAIKIGAVDLALGSVETKGSSIYGRRSGYY